MRKLQHIIVALTLFCMGFPAFAAEVTLLNRSGRTLCAAEAMTESAMNGSILMTKGWRCIPPEQSVRLGLIADDRFVSIMTESMSDFLPTQTPVFPLAALYVPIRWYNDYTIVILAKSTGGYSFTYQTNSGQWSEWSEVSRTEDLDRALFRRGFKRALAWHLESDAITESVTVILQP